MLSPRKHPRSGGEVVHYSPYSAHSPSKRGKRDEDTQNDDDDDVLPRDAQSVDVDVKALRDASGKLGTLLEYDEKRVPPLDSARSFFVDAPYSTQEAVAGVVANEWRALPPLPADVERQERQGRAGGKPSKRLRGLLPDINRAYFTLDHCLCLWDYHSGVMCTYDPLRGAVAAQGSKAKSIDHVIIALALLKLKPRVFAKEYQYALVVCTPTRVFMVLLGFEGHSVYGNLTLFAGDREVRSENVQMRSVACTPEGRVFLAAHDGALYELHYQAQDSWLSKKARLINHSVGTLQSLLPLPLLALTEDPLVALAVDEQRKRVITLSAASSIAYYDLCQDGMGLRHMATVTKAALLRDLKRLLPAHHLAEFGSGRIAHVSAVSPSDSNRFLVMGVTERGHRAYFRLSDERNPLRRLVCRLKVDFVRMWPDSAGDRERAAVFCYSKGVTLCAERRQLVCVWRSALEQLRKSTLEAVDMLGVPSTEAIAEVGAEQIQCRPLARRLAEINSSLSEFATQHEVAPRQWVVLADALHHISKKRPVDLLRDALVQCRGKAKLSELKGKLGCEVDLVELCAMCLLVACSPSPPPAIGYEGYSVDPNTGLTYSDTPSVYDIRTMCGSEDRELRPHAIEAFFYFASNLESNSVLAQSTTSLRGGNAVKTAGYQGLWLYLARLLRPAYDYPVLLLKPGTPPRLTLTYDQLKRMGELLGSLQLFVHEHKMLLDGVVEKAWAVLPTGSAPSASASASALPDPSAANRALIDQEKSCQKGVFQVLERSVEITKVLLFCHTHNFPRLASMLKPEELKELSERHFIDLLLGGFPLANSLLRALTALPLHVSDPLQAQGMREELSKEVTELYKDCPNLLQKPQLLVYRANEALQNAPMQDRKGAETSAAEALRYYKKAANSPDFDLKEIAIRMRTSHLYSECGELCLHRMKLLREKVVTPPAGPGHRAPSPEEWFKTELERATNEVGYTLDLLLFNKFNYPEEERQYVVALRPEPTTLARHKDTIVSSVMEEKKQRGKAPILLDPAHFLLNWFIVKDAKEELLGVPTWVVEEFFSVAPAQRIYDDAKADYYLKRNMLDKAANLFRELATGTPGYTLKERQSHLARALGCAKACVDKPGVGETVFLIQDQLSLCVEQRQLMQKLDPRKKVVEEERKYVSKVLESPRSTLRSWQELQQYLGAEAWEPKGLAKSAILVKVRQLEAASREVPETALKAEKSRLDEECKQLEELEQCLLPLEKVFAVAASQKDFKCCLALLHFEADYNTRAEVIQRLWQNALKAACMFGVPTATWKHGAPTAAWRHALREVLVELTRKYGDVPQMFPLGAIVRQLESLRARMEQQETAAGGKGDQGPAIADMLRLANVPLGSVLPIYHALLADEPGGQWVREKGDEALTEREQQELADRAEEGASGTAVALLDRATQVATGSAAALHAGRHLLRALASSPFDSVREEAERLSCTPPWGAPRPALL